MSREPTIEALLDTLAKEEQDALAFEESWDWYDTNCESQERPYQEDI